MILHDIFESHQQCPECGGPAFSDLILAEKKDACYYKVKASAKVWPSAYASGRLVQCRKKGAANWGNKSKNEGVAEASIPYALSAANANAEYRRQGAAGGGYRGRIDIPVQSREDYISAGRALKKAAAAAGQKIEYGLSNGVMSVFSDSMDADTLDQFIDSVLDQGVAEGLADDFMKMAQARGYNPRKAGTPEQERERTQQMLAQRAKERDAQAQQAAQADAERLPELKAEYDAMLTKYQSLGGNNWQYADREQNLTDQERQARSMEPELSDLQNRISRAQQAQGMSEAQQPSDKIANRYDPDEFDDMISRLKKLAGAGPLKTVWDPQKRVYRNMPVAQQPKK